MAATAEQLYCKLLSPLQAGTGCCCSYLPVLLITASLFQCHLGVSLLLQVKALGAGPGYLCLG